MEKFREDLSNEHLLQATWQYLGRHHFPHFIAADFKEKPSIPSIKELRSLISID